MSTDQQTKAAFEVVDTELTVAYVKYGGNAGDGQYFFAFSNQHIHVRNRRSLPPGCEGVLMRFRLGNHVPANFVITGLVSTNSMGNLVPESIYRSLDTQCRNIEVLNQATQPGIFNVGILVTDLNTGALVFCDPQVVNSPGEGDNC
jgi:hypothetical protein